MRQIYSNNVDVLKRYQKKNIAVFASHGGSDLQAIIDGCVAGVIPATVCVVISNNSGSRALERAGSANIPAFHVSEKKFPKNYSEKIFEILQSHKADIVFLAGFLKKMPDKILREYEGRIFNIHPSLLPKFGGKGMFGINVHTAVLAAGETETGITIHRVTAEYDAGEILAQRRIPVLPGDTPETLAARVLEQEHIFLVEFFANL
ncbi:MAG: phosphoribosylglycinamide formyltransferase [Defluviitaleaceae bacterium]|nr:phosphoribosylglycinamide formyltransferase [Defluviitaleaceae bacterium]